MKELSIEEKARRYDEALKEAVIAHKDEDRHLKATLVRIFPELAKPDDARIRRKLLNLLKELLELGGVAQDTWSMIDCKQFIAWVEKQGEQKPAWSEKDAIMHNDCICAIEAANESDYTSEQKEELANWLKSIKERMEG